MPQQIRIRLRPLHCTLLVIVFLALVPRSGRSQTSTEPTTGERLAHEYEKQVGLGSTLELERISSYISSIGNRVASALPSHARYHFVFDPNPAFKSAFALPDGYIIVGGGLLALAQTEDELASALAHEIEHVELGQVNTRVTELTRQKNINELQVSDFFSGYGREKELACDVNGQKLAAQAGYSPAGMLTLLETFKSLQRGSAEKVSQKRPTLAERIAQANRFVSASKLKQMPLNIP
ncbi:MAG TPA: M48 family metallopeptidase [Candidatus Angelobacter sp.]|nr:M48 family metallopeptidase [Candidatus Angelobacter sp.]